MKKRRTICFILAVILMLAGCGKTSAFFSSVTKNISPNPAASESAGLNEEEMSSAESQKTTASRTASQPEVQSESAAASAQSDAPDRTSGTGEMTVHFLDVGEGDATLIESDGHFLLMDGGDRDHSSFVVSYLKKQGVSTLDYVIASHFDDDHINGIVGALHVLAVSEMLEPGYAGTTSVYQSLKDIESQKSIAPVVPKAGDSYHMGSISFTVVGPTSYSHDDENDNSLCVLVTCGSSRFLFTGDAQETSEKEICGTGISLSADVLEAGHHGSSTSNSGTMLNAVSPKYMVISCGKDNSYGLPDQDVIERIRDKGISLFRTDEQGTILATSDGTNITWSTVPSTTWACGSAADSSESGGSAISTEAAGDTGTAAKYILNTHTMKFHLPGCKYAEKISKKNYAESNESRDQLIAEGYSPCGYCNP